MKAYSTLLKHENMLYVTIGTNILLPTSLIDLPTVLTGALYKFDKNRD